MTEDLYTDCTIYGDSRLQCPLQYDPLCEKINNLGVRLGPTQTGLCSHRWLEACNFRSKKMRDQSIPGAKTKALISCAVTAQLICTLVFAYANFCFSDSVAHGSHICFITMSMVFNLM